MLNELKYRIDILAHSTQDSAGGPGALVVFLANVPAGVEDLQGKEVHTASQFASDLQVRFTVRWNPTINASQLVRFEDRVYTISYTKDPATIDPSIKTSSRRVAPPRLRHQYLELYAQLFNDGAQQ